MKTTRLMTLLILLFWICATVTQAATWQWTYALLANATVFDALPDGKGGALVCWAVPTATTCYLTYVNKAGVKVWQNSDTNATIMRARLITKKQIIITLYRSTGESEVHDVQLKTGTDTLVAADDGWAYTADVNLPMGIRDTKGFFVHEHNVAGSSVYVQRYTYK